MPPPWHQDDRFWETFAAALFDRDRLQRSSLEVDQLLALAGAAPPAAVLDLCCGPGRHALELARRGYRVTGVDRTAAYLERARAAAAREGLKLELVEADMRDFERAGAFDLAINLFTSFGYFDDLGEDRRVLERLFASLRPGGRLVLELQGKEVLARLFRDRDWLELDDGTLVLEERRVVDGWSRIESRWRRIASGAVDEALVTHRLYSAAELGALLREAGFAPVESYGSLAGAPYDQHAERLVLLAMRPER